LCGVFPANLVAKQYSFLFITRKCFKLFNKKIYTTIIQFLRIEQASSVHFRKSYPSVAGL